MFAKETIKIAVVDDDEFYNRILTKYIHSFCKTSLKHKFDFRIESYLSAAECIENLDGKLDIMVLDYYFHQDVHEDVYGSDVLNAVKQHCQDCKVIMISSQQNLALAVELMKQGVYDYVDKTVNSHNRIGHLIQRILTEKTKYR